LLKIVENENLKKLNLYALPYLRCNFLDEMKCSLEFLDICGNTSILDEIFIRNAHKLENLKYLNLVIFYYNLVVVYQYNR